MLKPQATTTREPVDLDGLWRFAIDAALGERRWEGRLDSRLEAAVPASYNWLGQVAMRDRLK
ncbi:hypothetical protein [Microbacterium sp.]|uniref:hypothetical protein n=1 Tax=Microbacterium sp. TaxID=51671 RepID=UPI0027328DAB|nr:hypothetical protein [Microbacterium sp.]MDP3949788.1 hypothetical protein [Microbacterium sp.]